MEIIEWFIQSVSPRS